MHYTSTYKILLLLSFLLKKPLTKKEIVEKYASLGFDINRPTINSYVKKLEENGFSFDITKQKGENLYTLRPKKSFLRLSDEELSALDEVKRLLFLQKDYNMIRQFMRLFYKLSVLAPDKDIKERLFDFGYYSSLNWYVVQRLEEHCKTKDILLLEYFVPGQGFKLIQMHVDYLKVATHKNKLYLHGILGNGMFFSHIAVDKIFMIKKVIRRKVMFEVNADILTYVISKEAYENTTLDESESLLKLDDKYAYIQRLRDDNFYVIQRLLYFCPDLYYISDLNIKNQVKEKLEIMKDMYERELDP